MSDGGQSVNFAGGNRGASGMSGYSGYSGIGTSGFSGYSGIGLSGYSGYSGLNGMATFSGFSGYSGYSGVFGVDGVFGGDSQLYSFDTSTLINPSSGNLRLNNSNPLLATFMYVSIDNNTSVDITSWLASLSNSSSTPKGRIRLVAEFDYGTFYTYDITGNVVNNTTYFTIPISVVTGIGSFSLNELVFISFSETGQSGYSGYSGVGTSGYSGISGYSGYSGYSGANGSTGTSGYSGYSGTNGSTGTSGFSGYSGISGYSGYSGTNGVTGTSGYSGYSGISGYSGFSGTNGSTGTSGFSGYSGTNGLAGVSGFSGYSGISGISGYSGYSGTSGFSGYSGYSGFSGYSGYSGVSGYSGYSGISGYSGVSGFSGFSGINGATGTSGYSGFSGISGYSGFSGTNGVTGTSGYSGYSGSNGSTGTSGFSGYSGTNGSTGTSGFSGYSGFSGTNGSVGTSGFSGFSGTNGTVGTSGFSGYSGYSGTNGSTGTSGFSGYSGINGSTGTSGFSGYSGISGYSGFSGVSGANTGVNLVYSNSSVPAGNTIANQSGSDVAFDLPNYSIPANSLVVGSVVRVKLWGVYSTAAVDVTKTITVKLKLNGNTYLTTGAITTVLSLTNLGWWADAVLTIFSIGASGTTDAQAFGEFATAATTGLSVNIDNATTQTIDTTIAQPITVTVNWGTTSPSNSITLRSIAIYIDNLSNAATAGTYLPLAGGNMTGAINEFKGANIASASTTNIGAATGNYVNITGTTTITAFDTVQAGTERTLNFNGILTLTYNATSLILQGATNIITAVGDVAKFVSLGSGNWVCIFYQRALNIDDRRDVSYYKKTGTATYERWYSSNLTAFTATTIALAKDTLRAFPFVVSKQCTVDRIAMEITGSGTALSVVRLAIYDDVNGVPTNLIIDAGTIAGDSATFQNITINQGLQPGLYYLVLNHNSTANITFRAIPVASCSPIVGLPSTLGASLGFTGITSTLVYTTMPLTFTTTGIAAANSIVPIISVRLSA